MMDWNHLDEHDDASTWFFGSCNRKRSARRRCGASVRARWTCRPHPFHIVGKRLKAGRPISNDIKKLKRGGQAQELLCNAATEFVRQPRLTSMAPRVNSSLEALGALLHLIRHSLGNPVEATTYLNIADKVLIEIASSRPRSPGADSVPSRPPARR
jgi:hypothetical protein